MSYGYDRSLKSNEDKNFRNLEDFNGKPIIGKSFNGNDVFFKIGPALEAKGKSWLTGERFPQYSTIIWLPNALAPTKGIVILWEEVLNAINSNNIEQIAKFKSIGLPDQLMSYHKKYMEFK